MAGLAFLPIQEEFLAVVRRNGEDCIEFLRAHQEDDQAIEDEYANLLAAIEWNCRVGVVQTVVEQVKLMHRYWAERGYWNDAVHYLETAYETSLRAGDLTAQARVSNNLGNFLVNLGSVPQALHSYSTALTAWEEAGDRNGMARAMGNLGLVHARMGEMEKALEYYLRSLEITESTGEDTISANQYDNLGRLYSDQGEWGKAKQYLLKSLKIRRRLKEINAIGRVHLNLGIIYYYLCTWSKALAHYEEARVIFEKRGDKHGLAMVYQDMGVVHHYSGQSREDWKRAAGLLQKAITYYRQLGEGTYGLARTYCSLGDLNLDMGQWEKALSCYEEARRLVDKEGPASATAGEPQLRMGVVYLEMEQWDTALRLFEEARGWLEQHQDRFMLIQLYGGLSEAFHNIANMEQAFAYGQRCLSLAEGPGEEDRRGKALAYRVLARAHYKRGDEQTGRQLFLVSLELYHKLDMWYQLGKTYYEMGLCVQLEDREFARSCLEKAQAIFDRLGAFKALEKVKAELRFGDQ